MKVLEMSRNQNPELASPGPELTKSVQSVASKPVELSYDELHTIMTFLPQADLSTTMAASPALFELGLPILLRSPIFITPGTLRARGILNVSGLLDEPPKFKPSRLSSILHFFRDFQSTPPATFNLSRLSNIGHLLRDLRIRMGGRESVRSTNVPLYELLHAATDLHTLDINDCEEFYHLFPEFPRLVGALTKLTRLGLSDVNQALCVEVMRHSLPLTHVYISFKSQPDSPPQSWQYDFAPMLKRCSATLESIHLDFIRFSSIAELVFPRAHTFGVGYLEVGIRRSTLVRHFPRLSTLYIENLFPSSDSPDPLIEWHALNSREPSQLQWSHLERINVPHFAIYGLDLRCTSGFLRINVDFWEHPQLIDPIQLVNCRPKSMVMIVDSDCGDLLQVFLRNSPQLTHVGFNLMFPFDNDSTAEEVFELIDSCIETLRCSSCTHIFIHLTFSMRQDKDLYPLLFAYWQHRCMLAQQLVDAIPSLQSIHLATHCTGEKSTWLGEVVNISGKRIVQQVEELQEVPEPIATFRVSLFSLGLSVASLLIMLIVFRRRVWITTIHIAGHSSTSVGISTRSYILWIISDRHLADEEMVVSLVACRCETRIIHRLAEFNSTRVGEISRGAVALSDYLARLDEHIGYPIQFGINQYINRLDENTPYYSFKA
ncbi:hypothetical protein K474DRAFT_1314137 [Panus rudis PR-1116 ss-1]|nr:hypothetical protein K474DRAFT_1314137 [Panus rudis PR-1116 ss-1]